MCHSHLQKFAEEIAKMEALVPPLKAKKDLQMASVYRSPNRRRRASFSDITSYKGACKAKSHRVWVKANAKFHEMLEGGTGSKREASQAAGTAEVRKSSELTTRLLSTDSEAAAEAARIWEIVDRDYNNKHVC